jgi:ArsR family transcriptional regulator
MKIRNLEIFEIHASYCRVLANPLRLAILACLDKRELSVGEIAEILCVPLSTVSRHLSALKGKHLVVARKEGHKVFYSPADQRIIEACGLIRTVLIDGMKKRGEIAMEIKPDEIIVDD